MSFCKLCKNTGEAELFSSYTQRAELLPCRCLDEPTSLINQVSDTLHEISELKDLTRVPQMTFIAQRTMRRLAKAIQF